MDILYIVDRYMDIWKDRFCRSMDGLIDGWIHGWMVGWIDRYCTHVLHTSFCLQLVVELVRLQAGAGTKRLIQKVFHST